ncbi:MAG: TonB-dependent receptor [Rhodanobacteraceae bacterium]|nr:TonB-dependent receptor [Rhodanobacteraceae bacterium]MBK7044233.1 TonB-dependent receptor [Rhodanobacteraceae bacterium]MBP9154252.1 TonB-dependent receptor [Xanthomonadales bacterium]HQW80345.1 TonB-dependent receptor [Pseudomonadota bacterium]
MLRQTATTLACAIALTFVVPSADAADTTTRGPTIEVTARRESTAIDASLAAVHVIVRAEIERHQAGDLLELLRSEVGIDITRSGGVGQATTLFLRGSNSNHTLFLIDGVRVASANSGLYDLAHLPLANVERIEIVRGPRAAFWGSDAIGGVVQIFTRKVDGFAGRIMAGKYGRLGTDVSFGGQGEHGEMSVTFGQEQTDGFSATKETAYGFDPDRDGYENNHARVNIASSIGEQMLRFVAQGTQAEVEFDQGVTDAENASAMLSIEGAIADRWTHRLDLGHSREDLDTPAYFGAFEARRSTLDWHHQYARNDATTLSGGLNFARERGAEFETFGNTAVFATRRHNAALYAGVAHHAGAHDLEFTGRYDDSSVFGGETTVQAAWGWRFADTTRLRASFGQGFRAPSLNELFTPGYGGLFAGNPALQPEQSDTFELGLHHDFNGAHGLELSAYRTRVDDLISFSGGALYQAINIARADIDGVELEYNGRIGAFSITANATLQDAENRDTRLDLLRRPGRKGNLSVDYRFDNGASVSTEVFGSGTRDDFNGTLPGYGLLHLIGNLPFGDRWRVGLRIENLLDRDYEVLSGYNTPGRGAYLTISYGE